MAWLVMSLLSLTFGLYLCAKLVRYHKIDKQIEICPNCLYPEHPGKDPYDVTTPCVECGLPWSIAERRFIRKRRLVRLAGFGALALSLLAGVTGYRDTEFVRWLPERLLAAHAPLELIENDSSFFAWLYTPMHGEITRRQSSGTLSKEALAIYAQRLVDDLAKRGKLVRTRAQWPRDVTVHVQPCDMDSLSMLGRVGLRIRMSDGYLVLDHFSNHLAGLGDPTSPVPDHAVKSGVILLDVDVLAADGTPFLLASRRVELPIEFVDSWESLLQPMHLDTDVLLRDYNIRSSYVGGEWTTELWLNPRNSLLSMAALGLRVELLQNDVVLATDEYHHMPLRWGQWPRQPKITIAARLTEIGPLQIRLTPDPHVALRDFDADSYWEGEPVVLPAELWRVRE